MLEAFGLSCSDFFSAMMAHQYNRAFAMVASAVMRFFGFSILIFFIDSSHTS
jgi:hypothetical protein